MQEDAKGLYGEVRALYSVALTLGRRQGTAKLIVETSGGICRAAASTRGD